MFRSRLNLEYLETRETPSSVPAVDPYGNPLPPPTDPGPTQPPPPSGGGGSTGPIDPYSPPPHG